MILIDENKRVKLEIELFSGVVLMIVKYLSTRKRIDAIRIMKSAFDMSLKEAKEYVDFHYPLKVGIDNVLYEKQDVEEFRLEYLE